MKVRSITVKYGRKFDLGNWNSAVIEALITGDLEEGEDAATAAASLFDQAKAQVKTQAKPLFTKLIDERLDIIANLPPEFRADLLNLLQERIGHADQTTNANP